MSLSSPLPPPLPPPPPLLSLPPFLLLLLSLSPSPLIPHSLQLPHLLERALETSLSPANGTIISAEAGSKNIITIHCNISTAEPNEGEEEEEEEEGARNKTTSPGQQLLTSWQLENFGNHSGLVPIATVMSDHAGAICLRGESYASSPFFETYQNELTFLRFLSEFNGTVLSCGRGDTALNLGRFPLVVYGELTTPTNHAHKLSFNYVPPL